MKNFKIYQLPIEHKAKFMDFEFVTKHNIMPKLEEYRMVYEGEMNNNPVSDTWGSVEWLNTIFHKFNVAHPEDFKGHSLSTSDIVEIDGKYFYCDSYGWEEVFSQPENIITFKSEDVPQEEIGNRECEITCIPSLIHFAKNGDLLHGNIKIGTYYKEVIGGHDASGNKLVPFMYWVEITSMPHPRGARGFYSRKEVKEWLDNKKVKVSLQYA